ncbi:hypothetical protein [Microbacterium sp. SLBN-111]|uniref:hypothetical protein n=1 Tax=Microbacterium sp. SLBN-111 TaxID=3377733 RepID=UPI003C728647
MVVSDVWTGVPGDKLRQSTCRRCGHGNATVRIVRTLFRRRTVAECSFIDEPVSGLAGAEVCLCRGEAHQTVLTH